MPKLRRQHALGAYLGVREPGLLASCRLPVGDVADSMDQREVLPRQQGEEQQQLRDEALAAHSCLVQLVEPERLFAWQSSASRARDATVSRNSPISGPLPPGGEIWFHAR